MNKSSQTARLHANFMSAAEPIRKYLHNPLAKPAVRKPRNSKLDPFKPVIRELLDQWPRASSVVIGQRIQSLGYTGGRSILQEYVATLRQIPESHTRLSADRIQSRRLLSRSIGGISVRSIIRGTNASCTPSAGRMSQPHGFTSSLLTANALRPSSAVTSMPFSFMGG